MMAACEIRVLGGAMARAPYAAWVRRLSAELDDGDLGADAGLLEDEGRERIRAANHGATWQRLAAVKATYAGTVKIPLD
jgi:hypothetical protein